MFVCFCFCLNPRSHLDTFDYFLLRITLSASSQSTTGCHFLFLAVTVQWCNIVFVQWEISTKHKDVSEDCNFSIIALQQHDNSRVTTHEKRHPIVGASQKGTVRSQDLTTLEILGQYSASLVCF